MFGVGVATSATTHAQWWGRGDQSERQRQREYEREQRRRQREYEREQRRAQRQYERQQNRNGGYYDPYNRNGGYYGNDGRYGNSGYFDNARQTALNAGYNNGIQEGRKDRQRGDRFEYRDEGDYQSATEDYSSRLGIAREQYRAYCRRGFANGYRAGYNGY